MLVVDYIAAGVIAVLILFLAIYFVCRYSAEEEDGDAWLPRFVVVLTLCAACYMVLLLPFEVALTDDMPKFDFEWAWKGTLIAAYALLLVVNPFAFVFYESWSPEQTSVWAQVRPALVVVVLANTIFAATFGALWFWGDRVDPKDGTLARVPPFVYFVATTASFGWCFFFVFAGVGLAAVPVNAVTAFVRRPRPITRAEYEQARARLNVEVQQLLESGRRLDVEVGTGRPSSRQRQKMLRFRRDVREAERQSERNEAAYHITGGSIVRSYLSVVLAVVNSVATLLWTLQILLSNILHVYPLLDRVVCFLDSLLPLLATLVYAYFALYLMWCTVVGCRTVSGNVLMLPVYPLRVRGTMLNALLFNSLLLLCSAFAVLQLCAISFTTYAASTYMHSVFAVTLPRMFGIRYVAEGLQYALLAVFVLAVPWVVFCPRFLNCAASGGDDDTDDECP